MDVGGKQIKAPSIESSSSTPLGEGETELYWERDADRESDLVTGLEQNGMKWRGICNANNTLNGCLELPHRQWTFITSVCEEGKWNGIDWTDNERHLRIMDHSVMQLLSISLSGNSTTASQLLSYANETMTTALEENNIKSAPVNAPKHVIVNINWSF